MQRTFTPASLAAISARLETAIRPHRRRLSPVEGTRRAAVFIPLCNVHGVASVLFTLRSHSVGTHKGQVSFPGGHREGGERSHNTALRCGGGIGRRARFLGVGREVCADVDRCWGGVLLVRRRVACAYVVAVRYPLPPSFPPPSHPSRDLL